MPASRSPSKRLKCQPRRNFLKLVNHGKHCTASCCQNGPQSKVLRERRRIISSSRRSPNVSKSFEGNDLPVVRLETLSDDVLQILSDRGFVDVSQIALPGRSERGKAPESFLVAPKSEPCSGKRRCRLPLPKSGAVKVCRRLFENDIATFYEGFQLKGVSVILQDLLHDEENKVGEASRGRRPLRKCIASSHHSSGSLGGPPVVKTSRSPTKNGLLKKKKWRTVGESLSSLVQDWKVEQNINKHYVIEVSDDSDDDPVSNLRRGSERDEVGEKPKPTSRPKVSGQSRRKQKFVIPEEFDDAEDLNVGIPSRSGRFPRPGHHVVTSRRNKCDSRQGAKVKKKGKGGKIIPNPLNSLEESTVIRSKPKRGFPTKVNVTRATRATYLRRRRQHVQIGSEKAPGTQLTVIKKSEPTRKRPLKEIYRGKARANPTLGKRRRGRPVKMEYSDDGTFGVDEATLVALKDASLLLFSDLKENLEDVADLFSSKSEAIKIVPTTLSSDFINLCDSSENLSDSSDDDLDRVIIKIEDSSTPKWLNDPDEDMDRTSPKWLSDPDEDMDHSTPKCLNDPNEDMDPRVDSCPMDQIEKSLPDCDLPSVTGTSDPDHCVGPNPDNLLGPTSASCEMSNPGTPVRKRAPKAECGHELESADSDLFSQPDDVVIEAHEVVEADDVQSRESRHCPMDQSPLLIERPNKAVDEPVVFQSTVNSSLDTQNNDETFEHLSSLTSSEKPGSDLELTKVNPSSPMSSSPDKVSTECVRDATIEDSLSHVDELPTCTTPRSEVASPREASTCSPVAPYQSQDESFEGITASSEHAKESQLNEDDSDWASLKATSPEQSIIPTNEPNLLEPSVDSFIVDSAETGTSTPVKSGPPVNSTDEDITYDDDLERVTHSFNTHTPKKIDYNVGPHSSPIPIPGFPTKKINDLVIDENDDDPLNPISDDDEPKRLNEELDVECPEKTIYISSDGEVNSADSNVSGSWRPKRTTKKRMSEGFTRRKLMDELRGKDRVKSDELLGLEYQSEFQNLADINHSSTLATVPCSTEVPMEGSVAENDNLTSNVGLDCFYSNVEKSGSDVLDQTGQVANSVIVCNPETHWEAPALPSFSSEDSTSTQLGQIHFGIPSFSVPQLQTSEESSVPYDYLNNCVVPEDNRHGQTTQATNGQDFSVSRLLYDQIPPETSSSCANPSPGSVDNGPVYVPATYSTSAYNTCVNPPIQPVEFNNSFLVSHQRATPQGSVSNVGYHDPSSGTLYLLVVQPQNDQIMPPYQ